MKNLKKSEIGSLTDDHLVYIKAFKKLWLFYEDEFTDQVLDDIEATGGHVDGRTELILHVTDGLFDAADGEWFAKHVDELIKQDHFDSRVSILRPGSEFSVFSVSTNVPTGSDTYRVVSSHDFDVLGI